MRKPQDIIRRLTRMRVRRPSSRAAASAARHLVMAEVGDQPTWWAVDATGSRRLAQAPAAPVKTVFRAAAYDKALAIGRLAGAKRQRLIIQELGERGVAFRDEAVTYCTPEVYAAGAPGRRTVPLGVLLARYRARHEQPLPITYVLRLGSEDEGIACAWTLGLDGTPGGFASAVVFDEAAVRALGQDSAEAARVPDAGDPVVLAFEEWYPLLASRVPGYPVPGTWAGVPTAWVRLGGLGVVALATGVTGLMAWGAARQLTQTRIAYRAALGVEGAIAVERAFDRHHLVGLARDASIAYGADLRAAQALAVPGARVTLQAGPEVTKMVGPTDSPRRATLTVRARMHHVRGAQIGATGSWPSRALAHVLTAAPPPGFALREILVNPHGTRYAARYVRP